MHNGYSLQASDGCSCIRAGEGARSPVEWVRLDPHGEALAAVRIAQPEAMAAAQLERSKDVAAQSDAIVQLAALRPTTYGVVNALRNCLRDPATYCRRALPDVS